MKIFITGGSGFIGGKFIEYFSQTNEIFALSRSEKSDLKIKNLGGIPVRGDLSHIPSEKLSQCDVVIHCAGYVESWGPKSMYEEINIEGTKNILQLAKEHAVPKFIQLSTEMVCFDGKPLVQIDESHPYMDSQKNLYGWSKAKAEKQVLAAKSDSFSPNVIRPSFVWGPDDTTALPIIIDAVQSGRFMWLNKGQVKKSTTHIDNLIQGLELVLNQNISGEVFFINDGESWTFKDFITEYAKSANVIMPNKNMPGFAGLAMGNLVDFVWKIFGIKSRPPITFLEAAFLSSEVTLKIDKARKELGYEPKISVRKGLEMLLNSAP